MKSIKFGIELARISKRKWREVICTGRDWGPDEERKCYLWL